MPGLIASAAFAVSVSVVASSGTAGSGAAMPQWAGNPDATLASLVESWASEAGAAKPVIDPAVGRLRIGAITLRAPDYCAATTKLVTALSHSGTHLALDRCAVDKPVVIADANSDGKPR